MFISPFLIASLASLGFVAASPFPEYELLEERGKASCKKSNNYTGASFYNYSTRCGYSVTGGTIFTDAKPPNFYGCVQSCGAYDNCAGVIWNIQYSVCEILSTASMLKYEEAAGYDAAIVIQDK